MRYRKHILAITTLLISLCVTIEKSYSQQVDAADVFTSCSNETSHTKLYEYGKELAEGWLYWLKKNTSDEKAYPVKTKLSFFTRAVIGLTSKYKIQKDDIVYHCYLGYNDTIKDMTWSSVHQGLMDYLPTQYKSKFISLPER